MYSGMRMPKAVSSEWGAKGEKIGFVIFTDLSWLHKVVKMSV